MYTQTYCFSKDVFYREQKLTHPFIESFFEIHNAQQTPIITIPDCCVEIHFFYADAKPSVYIAGTALVGRQLKHPITNNCFGIRFKPAIISNNFKSFFKNIIDSNYEITELFPFKVMLDLMATSASFENRMAITNRYIHCLGEFTLHPLVKSVIYELKKNCLATRIETIINGSGYSHRHVDRVFKGDTGMSVKFFSNVLRIQTAIHLMTYHKTHNMIELSAKLGFYDQAHFNRSFKQFTCQTPTSFASNTARSAVLPK